MKWAIVLGIMLFRCLLLEVSPSTVQFRRSPQSPLSCPAPWTSLTSTLTFGMGNGAASRLRGGPVRRFR
eukprot:3172452-Pyramimonas_sp.AAC.1